MTSDAKTIRQRDVKPDQWARRETVMADTNEGSSWTVRPLRGAVLGIVTALAWGAVPLTTFAREVHQMTFATPEQATDTLVAAERGGNTTDLVKILGSAGRRLIFSGDPVADQEGREKFVAAYDQKHAIDSLSDSKAYLIISPDDWPFPIPLVKQDGTWRFDTKDGAEEILNRRIGRNELNAIQVCAAIVDAEHEYARDDRTGSGYREYAQKFMSSDSKRDGLYWPATKTEDSPIGPLVAEAREEGYGSKGVHQRPTPYHGYLYRILKSQGKDAKGGAYDYVVNGHMIGGFALVAFPAKHGDSGVMTFITNQDGVIYEKNLGSNTAEIARTIKTFNPDASWQVHQ